LDESYVGNVKLEGDQTLTVTENNYFVLGDNRLPQASSDSREWGLLPRKNIVGKSWLRVIPLNELGFTSRASYQN
jgi:signal peptidase I